MKLKATTFISDIYSYRNVLQQLIVQQLILRYRRTVLGYFWTLVNPLLMMSVMAIVFSTLFKVDLKTFAIFLFAGMIPWGFFSTVVGQSGGAFIHNEGLIKKIYLPKIIFPLSIACALLIDCLLSFVALLIVILLIGGSLSWAMLFLPISFALLFVFAVGCSLMVSVATVFFRDLQYVIVVVLQGLFFLTPILYKQDLLLGKVSWLVKLNPVTPFITLFRTSIIDSALPTAQLFLHATAIACTTMGVGLFIFLRQEKKIVFRL